uniref:Uncharacterized protein n=1 Tax=Arundo donax TaxID=35708 RepID=A0A0A8YS78_ARUDO
MEFFCRSIIRRVWIHLGVRTLDELIVSVIPYARISMICHSQ